jgi:DNA topoisomerase-1
VHQTDVMSRLRVPEIKILRKAGFLVGHSRISGETRLIEGLVKHPRQAKDPRLAAKAAQLKYVRDDAPGISRHVSGKGFRYTDTHGRKITDGKTLARIRSLVIPPAWKDVWICAAPEGHLQATGRDARGRKQYRYHPRWRQVRDEVKYGRMLSFGMALARIRRRVNHDLRLHGMPRAKVLATIVNLLEKTLIRVGNEEYARLNGSFGLTTLRDQHAEIHGSTVQFHFRGKSGKRHQITLTNPRLARMVKRCQDLPGHELFQYVDEEGHPQTIGSADVNDYLRGITGDEFTAKDFRTWAGTLLAATTLIETTSPHSARARRKRIVAAIQTVAERLGNTVAVCRKCYIHPAVLDCYLEGELGKDFQSVRQEGSKGGGLRVAELGLIGFLQRRLPTHRRDSN